MREMRIVKIRFESYKINEICFDSVLSILKDFFFAQINQFNSIKLIPRVFKYKDKKSFIEMISRVRRNFSMHKALLLLSPVDIHTKHMKNFLNR